MNKISIKREQSQAGLSFAEREKFRPQVKNKLLLLLVLLAAVVTGAVAQTTYKVSVKEGTEDAANWTVSPTEAAKGATVTTNYSGNKKVGSIKVVKKKAPAATDLSTIHANYTASNGETLTGTLASNVQISIADGATVTLNNVTINGTNNSNYKWAGITCEGDATIILSGTNTVKGFYGDYPGIQAAADKTLTINGTGSLTASSYGYSAGIGGAKSVACGNIEIQGGTITATGGQYGAGIGGGYNASWGNITISGGTVTAKGGLNAAGIGGGRKGGTGSFSGGNIIISGGTVTATGGNNAAGIGGGKGQSGGIKSSCGTIEITTGVTQVTATKGNDAPNSIGAGYLGTCGTVTIGGNEGAITDSPYTYDPSASTAISVDLSTLTDNYVAQDGETLTGTLASNVKISIADGATVTLNNVTINASGSWTSGDYAGITCLGDATIILSGTNTVKGFNEDYPGIYVYGDSDNPSNNKTLTIKGSGSLTVSSNDYGAGIGGGFNIDCGNIDIQGGTVTATGGTGCAGIGSGNGANCGNITISGGTVTATGDSHAAGIGSGDGATCGNITISGGTVEATGGNWAAGIGSGNQGTCNDITISGGTVTATGASTAAGIGSGRSGYLKKSSCGAITISGGTVEATGGGLAAGIGSGANGSSCGDITITSGVTHVTATKGEDAPNSIGASADGTCGTVSIEAGANVTQN